MSAVQSINPHAEVVRRAHALSINVNAAIGMQEVLKTNLGEQTQLKRGISCLWLAYSKLPRRKPSPVGLDRDSPSPRHEGHW
jgi:hypothetical protein